MDYLDTLREDGWLADPGERVRVVSVHARGCPANWGRPCSCDPRLVLAAYPFPREIKEFDNDLPLLDAACGE
jgi:hypothetical protein